MNDNPTQDEQEPKIPASSITVRQLRGAVAAIERSSEIAQSAEMMAKKSGYIDPPFRDKQRMLKLNEPPMKETERALRQLGSVFDFTDHLAALSQNTLFNPPAFKPPRPLTAMDFRHMFSSVAETMKSLSDTFSTPSMAAIHDLISLPPLPITNWITSPSRAMLGNSDLIADLLRPEFSLIPEAMLRSVNARLRDPDNIAAGTEMSAEDA